MGPRRTGTSERNGASNRELVSKTKFKKNNTYNFTNQRTMAMSFSDTLKKGLRPEITQSCSSTSQRTQMIGHESGMITTGQGSALADEFPALGASGTTLSTNKGGPKQTQPETTFKFERPSSTKRESPYQAQHEKHAFKFESPSGIRTVSPKPTQPGNYALNFEPPSNMRMESPKQNQPGNYALNFEPPSNMRMESPKQNQPGNYAFKFETPPTSTSTTTVANVRKRNLNQIGYKDLVDWLKNPNNVYIGRNMTHYVPGAVGSKWGNPFKNMEREECCRRYKKYIETDKEVSKSNGRTLLQSLDELKGKNLGCWCHPEKCHGHMLVELIEEYGV